MSRDLESSQVSIPAPHGKSKPKATYLKTLNPKLNPSAAGWACRPTIPSPDIIDGCLRRIGGPFFVAPQTKDNKILGSILVSPYSWQLPYTCMGWGFRV